MVVIGRKFSFSSCAMADLLTKNDPEMQVAKYLNSYWQTVRSRTITKILVGSMATSSMSNMVSNISTSGTIADANRLTKTNIATAIASKFGDTHEASVMIVNPYQYAHLIKLDCVDFLYDELYGRVMPKVLGMDILIDSSCTAGSNSTFTSFILGKNALVCAEAKESIPFAIVSDTGTREYLVTKKRYIAQTIGLSFNSTSFAGTSPTDAEIASSLNYTLDFASETSVPAIKIVANA